MSECRYIVDATVEAGPVDRQDAIVSVGLDCHNLLWHPQWSDCGCTFPITTGRHGRHDNITFPVVLNR